jgi:hypothetical protein
MMKWEYKSATVPTDHIPHMLDDLNKFGQDGWEVAHATHETLVATDGSGFHKCTTFLLKRAIYESGVVQLFGGDEEEDDRNLNVRMWLGQYRDHLPPEAVSDLQDILGVPK